MRDPGEIRVRLTRDARCINECWDPRSSSGAAKFAQVGAPCRWLSSSRKFFSTQHFPKRLELSAKS
jgi:hypothetical protein